jgi:hypothetical protein
MASQHAVDVSTSLRSLGWNRSLLGWKCDPDLPGLRDHFVFEKENPFSINSVLRRQYSNHRKKMPCHLTR